MAEATRLGGSRHSILDLAPLELDCMNVLWPAGEATVRDIQQALRSIRPRAYTTIMTILDRLAQKGIVHRRKVGRAWVYRANVSADDARANAVSQVVNGFFAGSVTALASHLAGQGGRPVPRESVTGPVPSKFAARRPRPPVPAERPADAASAGLDTTLL
jgi:predicted transcriptional regulator